MSSVARKIKLKQPAILKQQSSKLQQKLSLLRSQVTQKKKEKSMNQTSASSFRATAKTEFNQNINNQLTNSQKLLSQQKLYQSAKMNHLLLQKLSQMKLQGLQGKLLQKGVTTISKLSCVSQQQVDQWKDIAVGWRIKLKKLIKTLSSNPILTTTTITNEQKLPQQQHLQSQQKPITSDNNIQQIIQKRNQIKIFVPLMRQYDQEQQNYDFFDNNNTNNNKGLVTGEEQQQLLIDKLMKVLQPRKPILMKHSNVLSSSSSPKQQQQNANINKHTTNQTKAISWSKSVQQLQRQFRQKSHKTYPKQAILKQALIDMQHNQQILQSSSKEQRRLNNSYSNINNNVTKYCWKCFKRITTNTNNSILPSRQTRFFCTQQCLSLYDSQTALFQQSSSAFQIE